MQKVAEGGRDVASRKNMARYMDLSGRRAVASENARDVMVFGWWDTGVDMALLGLESQGVIVQRMVKLALGGPAACLEAQRMVTEKVFAAGETALMLAAGASNGRVIRNYRRKVRANARRLGGR